MDNPDKNLCEKCRLIRLIDPGPLISIPVGLLRYFRERISLLDSIIDACLDILGHIAVLCWRGLGRVIKEERYPQSQRIK